jgi:hypothetical protein
VELSPRQTLRASADVIIQAGAVGAMVYADGEIECAGFANLLTREQMTAAHRTWVGSIDKTYMALVAVSVFEHLEVPAARCNRS